MNSGHLHLGCLFLLSFSPASILCFFFPVQCYSRMHWESSGDCFHNSHIFETIFYLVYFEKGLLGTWGGGRKTRLWTSKEIQHSAVKAFFRRWEHLQFICMPVGVKGCRGNHNKNIVGWEVGIHCWWELWVRQYKSAGVRGWADVEQKKQMLSGCLYRFQVNGHGQMERHERMIWPEKQGPELSSGHCVRGDWQQLGALLAAGAE